MPIGPYNWKRFWNPRGKAINMDLDGYLPDPDSKMGAHVNSHLKMLNALQSLPCLILLGEPGMGKTTTLNQSRGAVDQAVQVSDGSSLWLDLHSYGDESRHCRSIFGADTFVAWRKGKGEFHLFLDSFDECLVRIETLAGLLADEIKRLPLERFRLRIASRSAAWPSSFEQELSDLWGKNCVEVYELAPLRRVDVIEAASATGLPDPDTFMRAVDEKQVVPLAIKPVTLQFLLNTYRKSG